MKKFIVLFCCLVSSSVFAATPPAAKFLQFVLMAEHGQTLKQSNGQVQLQLTEVNDAVYYFTNRPRRISGMLPTGFFLKRWIKPPPHDFVSIPPNAALLYEYHGKQTLQVVMLKTPVYDADTHSVTFTLMSLSGSRLVLPDKIQHPVITFAEVTVCGLLGSWGNLPGEQQSDVSCHEAAHKAAAQP